MRKLAPFVIGGGLFLYVLDEVHIINTSIKFGELTGDFATDAVIGWSIGIGLIVMAVKLLLMVFGEEKEEETYYYDEEYQEEEEEIYQEPVKITWWNDWYDD